MKTKGSIIFAFIFAISSVFVAPASLKAVEGARGIYPLGINGPQAGMLPDPGTYFNNQIYYYNGDTPLDPLQGTTDINVKVRMFQDMPQVLYVSPWTLLGANYATALIVPFGGVRVQDSVERDRRFGLGDIMFFPLMFGWHCGDFHAIASILTIFPTGSYKKERLANTSKHYYTIDPGFSFTWQNKDWGLEFSNWTGYSINFKNNATHYQSGGELHTEFFAGKTFECGLQIGAVAYYYKQLTKDSGKGAVLGSFKGRIMGLGPEIGYTFHVKKTPVSVNARYYQEFSAKNLLKGETFFFTVSFPFCV